LPERWHRRSSRGQPFRCSITWFSPGTSRALDIDLTPDKEILYDS
jgi:hypothetical protein